MEIILKKYSDRWNATSFPTTTIIGYGGKGKEGKARAIDNFYKNYQDFLDTINKSKKWVKLYGHLTKDI